MTTDQQALQLALEQKLAGVDKAAVYGSSRNFEPSEGRVRFVDVELFEGQKTMFIVSCEYVWFRGGVRILDPNNPTNVERVPDNMFAKGDPVAVKINLAWADGAAFPHIKAWCWAVLQLEAIKRGEDPSLVRVEDIDKGVLASVMMNFDKYRGMECDYVAEQTVTKRKGLFTRLTWLPQRNKQPGAATPKLAVVPQPVAPAPTEALHSADGTGAGDAQYAPPAPKGGALDKLVGMGRAAVPQPGTAGALSGLLAKVAAPAAPARAPLTRDEKIKVLRTRDARFSTVDFTGVDDAAINAAHAELVAASTELPY